MERGTPGYNEALCVACAFKGNRGPENPSSAGKLVHFGSSLLVLAPFPDFRARHFFALFSPFLSALSPPQPQIMDG